MSCTVSELALIKEHRVNLDLMNFMRSALAMSLLSAVSAAAISPAGSTYYVSSTGDNKDSGTSPALAWRSLTRVNQQRLRPGDTILLEGGSTFPGTITVFAPEGGTSDAPITFGSYGVGRATVWADKGRGFDIYNVGGIRIQDLVVAGAGIDTNDDIGIALYTDLSGGVRPSWVRIDNVRVTGFLQSGISIG